MSKSEVERFAKDLKSIPALLAEVVALAARHGYRFTAADAAALSDGQLDAIAGGYRQQVLVRSDSPQPLTDRALDGASGGAALDVERQAELAKGKLGER
jgi:hypothetical protein